MNYKLYAHEVVKELTKSGDEKIVSKFITELKKLSNLKQYEKYKVSNNQVKGEK